MDKYFFHDGQIQKGPYSLADLRQQLLTKETHIWSEPLGNWTPAKEVTELKDLFVSIPPPFQKQAANTQPLESNSSKVASYNSGRSIRKYVWVIVLLIIGATIVIYSNQSQALTAGAFTASDSEQENPSLFLNANGKYHPNLIGQMVIEGNVTNTAGHTNYKDVVIRVTYYSKTDSEIESNDYIIYDRFPYGSTKEFKLKLDKPSAAKSCGWEAINATPY